MSCRTLIGVIAGLGLLALGFQAVPNPALAQASLRNYAPTPRGLPPLDGDRMLPSVPDPDDVGPAVNAPRLPPPNDLDSDEVGTPRLLPPRAIVSSLASRGYRNVMIKRVRGDSYIVEAEGPEGGKVLIVVDGHTTEITGLRQLGWARPPRQWDSENWGPPRPWGGPRW